MAVGEVELREDIYSLQSLLDEILEEQVGPECLAMVEQLRRLAKERRAELPGAEERLVSTIQSLSHSQMEVAVRALSIFFDLANTAEDHQRIRVLRQREREQAPHFRAESLGAAIEHFRERGYTAEQVQELLDKLRIELVFTAHPTEAKRRTVRGLLRRMRQHLKQLERPELLPNERQQLLEQMRGELTILWQTDLLRPRRPHVMDEVERGLFFTEGLWEVVPQIYHDLRRALAHFYPDHPFRVSGFLRFGTWIGGDRDGNPYVTTAITRETLALLRQTAAEEHLLRCRDLLQLLVVSSRQVGVAPELMEFVGQAEERWPEVRNRLESISPAETYRRWLKVIEYRLEQTLIAAMTESGRSAGLALVSLTPLRCEVPPADEAVYHTAEELEQDLRRMGESLERGQGQRIAAGPLQQWLDLLQTFGLHLAALDVRQESGVYVEVLTEVLKASGIEDYAGLPESDKQRLLADLIEQRRALPSGHFSEQADESLSLFRLLTQTVRDHGLASVGGHVISMTHRPSDVLAVLWLWTAAWQELAPGEAPPVLPVIPLFETIEDLQKAASVVESLLTNPTYAQYVQRAERPAQMVMVGYSDSTKDGGYLSASWGLHRAQEQLADVAERHGVRLVVFHGRGGALGRGGGPAARAILSLPRKSVAGALRMTEQGEVLAERYDDPQIAYRHLEQVTWATMLISADAQQQQAEPSGWSEALDQMAQRSYEHYRRLVEDPGFLPYFEQATPIAEIERLPIGSRPSRRRERRSLADLRAIPWTFAWTQCRQIIPAWFGLGSAVHDLVERSGGDWSFLQQMYDRLPLFRALIENADLALAKADIGIAHRYADLARDHDAGERIWNAIAQEYRLTRSVVLLITRQGELLGGTPWLRRSIQERNPYVDPLTLIQIELIRRVRALAEDHESIESLRSLLRLTIQGVAAGMRTTG